MLGLNQRPPPYQDGATATELIRYGRPTRIRTRTNRVKVCGATVTLWANVVGVGGLEPSASTLKASSYTPELATGEGLEPPWAVRPADLETAAIAAMRTGNNLGAECLGRTDDLSPSRRLHYHCANLVCLVAGEGVEPPTSGYEPDWIPFPQPAMDIYLWSTG